MTYYPRVGAPFLSTVYGAGKRIADRRLINPFAPGQPRVYGEPPRVNGNAQALIGQWYSIVGAQQSGYPTRLSHGAYGGYGPQQRWAPMQSQGYDPQYWLGQEAPAGVPAVLPPPMPPPVPFIPAPMAMPPLPPPPPPPAFMIPPRNVLLEQAPPTRAVRIVLPMSTGVPILPTQSAQITARSQMGAFRPERIFLSSAGTSGGAADWIVNDFKIGNRSQFAQSGDVPGDMFATNAIDGFVSFETVQTAMDVALVVTYIGLNESGCPFFGSIVGTAAV